MKMKLYEIFIVCFSAWFIFFSGGYLVGYLITCLVYLDILNLLPPMDDSIKSIGVRLVVVIWFILSILLVAKTAKE